MKALLSKLLSLLAIIGFQLLGTFIQKILQAPVPAVVIGMLLLFMFLCLTKGKPIALIQTGSWLTGLLPLFFIPVGTGIMIYASLIWQNIWLLALSIALGTMLCVIMIAYAHSKLENKPQR